MWLTGVLGGLAPFVRQDTVVLGVVAVLFLWAILSGLRLWRASARVGRAFDAGASLLARAPDAVGFAASYEAISADLGKDGLIGASWRGFQHSLVVPTVAGRPIMATADARQWFDLPDLFRRAGADLRYHAALPGLLVGAGLLFTFLGLAAALSAAGAVVAEGVSQVERNAALRDLLGAASVKFVTSLTGLFLSIAYAIFRKSRLRVAEVSFSAFLGAVHRQLPFKTPAAMQADANALLEKQYAEIQQIGTDFFVNLGSVLERKFGEGMEQHIGPLAAAIEKLSAGLSNQNEDAMQAMLGEFLKRLEGAVGESMRGTAATLEALGGRLDGLQAGMDAASQRMSLAAEEIAKGMGRGATTALTGIAEQVGALVRGLREAAEEAGKNNRNAGDELARQMKETAAGLTHAVAAFQRELEKGAAEGVGRLAGPIEALLRQLEDLAKGQRAAGADASAEMAATMARAATALEDTARNVANVLGNGANDASNRLLAATEAMRNDLRDVLERLGAKLGDSGRAFAQGAADGAGTLRDAATALGGDLAAAAAKLREAGDAAGAALREGSAGLAERLSTLADRTQALQQAAQSLATPLQAGAADLRAAGEAAREAARPLQDVAREMGASLDGLIGAATAMTTAQQAAEQLAARFGTAADRFGGLDAKVAGTFDKLNEGLNGYQRQIADFVVRMDDGLRRSIDGLERLVKNLEETIADFNDRR